VGGEKDRWRRAIISASVVSDTNGCCSGGIPEPWIASGKSGSKGVTIICGPASMKSFEEDKIDLGLDRLHFLRRCMKVTIPITEKTAAIPPMVPPTIVPIFWFRFGGNGKFVFDAVPFAFIVCVGAL